MGKRNLVQSCVLFEVSPGKEVALHVNRLEFSNSKVGDNFEILGVCMGKRNLAQSCVLFEVTS